MTAPSFETTAQFAVPMTLVTHPAPEGLNRDLRSLFLAREDSGHANPQPLMRIDAGLFESRFDLFKWPDPCVRELREFCWSSLFRVVAELNGYEPARMARLRGHADAWFHITRKGGYFGLHNHAMASWSGVYCVDPGVDHSGRADSGVLSFPHPNPGAGMYVDLATFSLRRPFTLAPRQFRLQPGQLLLFPSWLLHQVLPYQGEGERITVAFNAWFREEPASPRSA